MLKNLLKISVVSTIFLQLTSSATYASPTNFLYLSGSNSSSSGILTYDFDFSEFICSSYGGTVSCGDEPNLSPIRVTGLDYIVSFSAVFSGLNFSPTSKTFTKNDLTDFSIYIDQVGNFWSTPSFIGDNIYTNEVPLIIGVPLPPSEDGWQATVDFVNGQTLYTTDSPNFPTPEPLTILGASTAIAFGAGFKRRVKNRINAQNS
jgi:hypothetical protein